jgi:hypothetical protein
VSRRLALLVLDAAEPRFLDELAAGGDLPAIAELRRRGAYVPLRSSLAYRAEFSCTELLTGQHAATTRYWSTVTFDPATYRCWTVGSARRAPFYAEPAAGTVVAFDLPHSVLVDDLPGAQVVGWGGHDARFQHPRASMPADLMATIDARFGTDPSNTVEYRGTWHQGWYIDALADALIAAARRRADIARWLLERYPDWTMFLMGMSELHAAGHNFAHGVDGEHLLGSHPTAALARERFVEVYRAVDDTVHQIVTALSGDTTVALTSSKGMITNRDDLASAILLPELLHRLAFGRAFLDEPASTSWRRRGCPVIWPDPDRRANARAQALRADGPLAPLKRRYRTLTPLALQQLVGALPRRLRAGSEAPANAGPVALAAEPLPDGTLPVLDGEINQPPMWYRRRWSSMPWFALPTFSDGHVRINLRGRERDGIVPVDSYERTCDELEATLRQVCDARTGEPIVDQVLHLRRDDPLAADGPGADLVVTWRFPTDAFEHPSAGVIGPFAFPRSGSHTGNGFLLLAGDEIEAGERSEHSNVDVAPTLLESIGWPRPSRLDGAPILSGS